VKDGTPQCSMEPLAKETGALVPAIRDVSVIVNLRQKLLIIFCNSLKQSALRQKALKSLKRKLHHNCVFLGNQDVLAFNWLYLGLIK
jgi:hypothetical protein